MLIDSCSYQQALPDPIHRQTEVVESVSHHWITVGKLQNISLHLHAKGPDDAPENNGRVRTRIGVDGGVKKRHCPDGLQSRGIARSRLLVIPLLSLLLQLCWRLCVGHRLSLLLHDSGELAQQEGWRQHFV